VPAPLKDNRLVDMHPIVVKFRRTDLQRVRAAAAHADEIVTLWIRETILLRLSRVKANLPVSRLSYEPLLGRDEPISIRFRPLQWRRIEAAARREKTESLRETSTWIRAVVLARTKEVLRAEAS